MDSKSSNIAPSVFYKSSTLPRYQSINLQKTVVDFDFPRRLLTIVDGPCRAWRVFQKQNDALKFSKEKGNGLMTFAFQESDGSRRFLSAHPVVFWFYDNHKDPENRRTYEVITEGAVSKLYFDLEFEKEYNKSCGVRMTNTFINIVCHFIEREFAIKCNRQHVLDMDSTTELKFSRHLIFNLPDAIFRDNYNVGRFVRMVCDKLRCLVLSAPELEDLCRSSQVSEENVRELFILDRKGATKLFCDEAVYTKNRHFRLYKSTKLKKNSPLLLSEENEYQPFNPSNSTDIPDKQIFLDSLVTYTATIFEKPLKILEYGINVQKKPYVVKSIVNLPDCPVVSGSHNNSPMPVIDRFIERVVSPGRVRSFTYYLSSKKILYEIAGNRFCHNINRAHKSNNVYYIVDLDRQCYYQKCHDPDCSGYCSVDIQLPPEILFFIENEGDEGLSNSDLSDYELQQVWEAVQAVSVSKIPLNETLTDEVWSEPIPDCGLTDQDLLDATIASSSPVPDYGLSDSDMLNFSYESENHEG